MEGGQDCISANSSLEELMKFIDKSEGDKDRIYQMLTLSKQTYGQLETLYNQENIDSSRTGVALDKLRTICTRALNSVLPSREDMATARALSAKIETLRATLLQRRADNTLATTTAAVEGLSLDEQHATTPSTSNTTVTASIFNTTTASTSSTAAGNNKKKHRKKQQADTQQLDKEASSKEVGEIDIKALQEQVIRKTLPILDCTHQVLEKVIDDKHTIFLSWGMRLSDVHTQPVAIVENSSQREQFARNLTEEALNRYNNKGKSALYDVASDPNLEATFQTLMKDENFVNKLTKEELCRIGPNEWTPLHYIYTRLNKLKKIPLQ